MVYLLILSAVSTGDVVKYLFVPLYCGLIVEWLCILPLFLYMQSVIFVLFLKPFSKPQNKVPEF